MKTDFTVDLIWWGSLRLAPIIFTILSKPLNIFISYTSFQEEAEIQQITTRGRRKDWPSATDELFSYNNLVQ